MAINKQCFYKSAISDYKYIGKWVCGILAVVLLAIFSSAILDAINALAGTTNVPASVLPIFASAGTIVFFLYSLATQSVEESKKDKIYQVVPIVWMIIALVWLMSLVPYAVYSNIVDIPKTDGIDFLIQSILALVVSCVMFALTSPLALAYGRCKEPNEKPDKLPEEIPNGN